MTQDRAKKNDKKKGNFKKISFLYSDCQNREAMRSNKKRSAEINSLLQSPAAVASRVHFILVQNILDIDDHFFAVVKITE